VKLALKDEVLASDLPDLDAFARRLPEYFPSQVRDRFGDRINAHPLRREIVTTMLVNEVVDGAGVSYAFRLAEEMSATATDAMRAFVVASGVFDLPSLTRDIRALDNVVANDVADAMVLEARRLLDRASRWLLSNRPQPLAVGAELSRFAAPVRHLAGGVLTLLRGREREYVVEQTEQLTARGVPAELAGRVSALLNTYGLLDVIEIAELAEREGATAGIERSHAETAELYYTLSEHLDIDQFLSSVSALERGNRWHALARLALRDDLYSSLRAITVDVLRHSDPGDSADAKITKWEESNAARLERTRSSLAEIRGANRLDLPTLSVAARQVRAMAR
ncbi:MAG TPA: NAD-glutamate dehydrogenase, partial [Pseudonocardiaceae bacterium]